MSDNRFTSRRITVKQDSKNARGLAFIAALMVGLGITTAQADTVTFRQGAGGYASAVDTFLQQDPANAGTNNGASTLLGWDGDDPSGTGFDVYTLIRFDSIFGTNPGQIPPGAVITSATLTYTVSDVGDNGSVHQLLNSWTAAATFNSFCGASCDAGSEYGASVATAGAAALGTQTVDVRTSVQAWSDGTTNLGWIIAPTGTGGVDIRSNEHATITERPLLTVIFNQGAPTTNILRQPYLQMGTENSMTIVWRTEVATNSRVHFGTTQGILDQQANNAAVSVDHIVTINGLLPATRYWYDVGSSTSVQTGGSAQYYFDTSPTPGSSTPFRVWVLGDSGNLSAAQLQVRNAMQAYTVSNPPDLFLHVGDIAYDTGTDDEFTQKHFAVYQDIMRHTPSWHTLGNHEGTSTVSGQPGVSTGPYYSSMVLPTAGEAGGEPSGTEAYYSFDYGNVHFICLNSTQVSRAAGGPMALWLQADLAATDAQWVVAFWHHPPYSKGTHNSDTEIELVQMRENIMPILEAGGVDLVLSGHSHAYERSYLIDGTYSTPTPNFATLLGTGHIIDDGDGRPSGDGAYLKSPGINAREGEVVMVAGHGGAATGGSLNHPVMFHSESNTGSVILDISGNSISAVNLRSDGVITDSFTLMKGDLPPRVAQTSPPKDDVLASLSSITVTFSTPVTGVNAGDLTVNGSPATTLNPVSGTVYTFSGFTAPGSGNVSVVLAAGGIADAGNSSLLFAGDTWIYTIDTTAPTITLTQPARGAHTSLLDSVSVTFSKPVVNVSADDLTVNGSPATQVSGIAGTSGPFSFSGYASPAAGLVNVLLNADGIQDTQSPAHAFAGDSWTYVRTQGLVINEFLASNNTSETDENGEFDDYVEIFNPGVDPVDMGGMFLTDFLGFPANYRIPLGVTIPAGGHLVFWCDSTPSQGPMHTNFNLSRTGEQIGLFASEADDIAPIDTLTYGTQTTDVASGRFPDGSASFVAMPTTPGAANTISCISDGQCGALDGPCTHGVCQSGVCASQSINEGGSCSTGVACLTAETCSGGVCDGGTSTCGGGQTCDLDTGQCLVLPAAPLPVAVGATWKYLPGTAEPDPAWKTLLFNDGTWQAGASGFGYGPDCNTPALRGTTLSTMQNSYTSLYVRRTFSVPNPALLTSLTLTMDYDDAWVAYLNGTEVARSAGMGGTVGVPPAFNATTLTTDHECSTGSPANPAEVINLTSSISLLSAGNNVIAIQGHNRSTVSTDFSLIPSLTSTQTAGCATNADCGDSNPCTDDICNLSAGTCSNVIDNTNLCTDGVACTSDVCSAGACVSSSNCLFGQTCDTGTGQCGVSTATVSFRDGIGGYTATQDTFVHAGSPAVSNATAVTLIVDGPTVAVPGDERQTLVRFGNLFVSEGGPIPDGAVITSATLSLNITNASADGAELHRMLIPWADTDTWTTLGTGVQPNDTEAVATADVTSLYNGTVPAVHAINVTSSVAAWSAGGANFGWVLVTPAGGSDSWQFDSSEGATVNLRPVLSVTYSTAQPCALDADCDDSNTCNGAETCSNGLCIPGTALTCNDSNTCTTDSCVPSTGCLFTNNTNACNDGNACTTGDVCGSGACVPGAPLNCSDGAACTADTCNSITGCSNVDTCTGGQTCNLGSGLCESAAAQAVFQDGAGGYTGTVDTFLHTGSPTLNNAVVTPLIVDGPTVAVPGDERQTLLRFDSLFVSQGGPIPDGATIMSATLRLNITNPSVEGAELHRMLIPWADTSTWNSLVSGVQRDGVESIGAADITTTFNGTVPAVHDIDVTSGVAAWSANPASNNGWVLVTPAGGSDSWQFDSSEGATTALRPRLTVQYQAFSGPRARLDCSLSVSTSAPGGVVDADILLTNLGGLAAVRGYQTKILVARTSGSGSLDIGCPGGVQVNELRSDFLFSGQPSIFSVTNCGLGLASSSLLSGAVAVGPGAEYLSTYSLTVSAGAAPGSTFDISLAAFPDTALADIGANPIAFTTGPVCTVTVTGECTTNAQCNDGNVCTNDVCSSGSCTHPANTAGCDDGDACTTGDVCGGGTCNAGSPIVCNDGSTCTTDSCSAGACVFAPNGSCGVTGNVTYYRNNVSNSEPSTKPVPNVGVDATSDLVAEDITDTVGFYGIGGLAGNLTIAPVPKYGSPRASDHNGAITSFDASLAAQHSVLLTVLSSNQQLAADVTGNGTVSSLDAARISQFAVLMIDHFDAAISSGSDWRFLRCDSYVSATSHTCGAPSYAHNPITGSPTDNFYGILFGDVSGNWAPTGASLTGGTENSAAAADSIRAREIRRTGLIGRPAKRRAGNAETAILGLEGWSGSLASGATRELFVVIRNADGIEGLDLSLGFDATRLKVLAMEPAGIGAEFAAVSHQDGDSARVAAYGPVPLSGSGVVLKITVEAVTRLGGRLPISIEAQANEGRIPMRVSNDAAPRPGR